MARSGRKRKAGPRTKAGANVVQYLRPTQEREAMNDFRSAGPARRAVPPIEVLYERGVLSERQFRALARYADVATAVERSEVKCNIDFSVYGQGEGLPHFGVRKRIEVGWLERELGCLRDIAFAVCVEEKTLTQWAMSIYGSRMREKLNTEGKVIARWYEPSRKELATVTLELRVAGERLAAAIAA